MTPFREIMDFYLKKKRRTHNRRPKHGENLPADYIGEEMTNESFWKKLAQKAPGAVKKAIEVIQKIIKGLKGNLNKVSDGNSVKQFITDLEKAQDLAVNAVAEYLEGGKASERGRSPVSERGGRDNNSGPVGRGINNTGPDKIRPNKARYQLKRQSVQDRRGAFVPIDKAVSTLDSFSRDELVVFLQQLSPNGAWSDVDAKLEDQKPLTKNTSD